MNRRKFIINTGLGGLGLYFIPSLVSCSNKKVNLNTILGQSNSLLDTFEFLNKEGNKNFGYYHFAKDDLIIENYEGKEAFIFYKNGKVIGYTLQIEGNDFYEENIGLISKSLGKFKINFKNDFGQEVQWNSSGKIIKLNVNNFKDIPKLSFYSEFIDNNSELII
ncbi:hypothetical protein BSF41_28020 [Flavobacterium sp. ACN2]|jgi:hypothetical protein|uniref:hypothetical protein n=1 Tax=unclassified Flavobacterium TaxID=196869 RepID=UPI000BB31BDB|nr:MULTISPECIES: hypothetical protein [unclassified Flavobacterium]MDY0989538.1 hypothetical protein [Flavobacterium sp. CFBP9031]PBI87931.1 hypothetical protein BSF41_28020 [Flavobacterium sp. ACN2]